MPDTINRKKIRLSALLASAACMMMAAPAMAQGKMLYLAGYMGLNLGSDQDFSDSRNNIAGTADLESSPTFAGALGLRLTKNIRAEAELSYSNPDINSFSGNFGTISNSGDFETWTGLVNLYYDIPVDWKIRPYLSAGLGVGYFDGQVTSANGTRYSGSDYGLTWSAGAGLQYRTNDRWSWTAGYRYLDSADLNFGDLDLDYSNHEVRVGVKYDLDWK